MKILKCLIFFLLVLSSFQCSTKGDDEQSKTKAIVYPTPKQGLNSLYECIQDKLVIPEIALKAKIEATVMVEFTVDKNGKTLDFKSLNEVGYGCEEAAINALKNCETIWNPGKENLAIVDMKMKIPISFSLKNE